MNEENEWDHKISAEVKEGPADCIRMAEVTAVLKMKRHKAPALSGLTGRRNVWSMKLRVQDQEEDQRGPGERLYVRTVKHVS